MASATCSSALFGHNFEITRRTAFGGIYSEKLNNRKLAVVCDGVPAGFTAVSREGVRGLSQMNEQLYFNSGERYNIRIWAKTNQTCNLHYSIQNRYGIAHYAGTHQLAASDTYTLIEDSFMLFSSEDSCVFEVTHAADAAVEFMAFSVKSAEDFHGMRRDVIELLKAMKPAILRYPGGCYAEFYNWKDGLLPPDFRPCVRSDYNFLLPDTYGCDTHEVGIDEFMELCAYVGAEPQITVRLSDNTPADAADWVEYCNGARDTRWGAERIRRGHAEPYNVKVWYIGNEIAAFGRGNLTDSTYAAAENDAFVTAMKAVDPTIATVASTGINPDWDKAFLANKPLHDMASLHRYYNDPFCAPLSMSDIASIIKAPRESILPLIQRTSELYDGGAISFDEWNYSWGRRGTAVTGIYAAGILHMLIRNAAAYNIRQACYFTPLNEGAIRIYPHTAHLHTDGRVFQLLSNHIGNTICFVDDHSNHDDLDIVYTVQADGKAVISVINLNTEQPHTFMPPKDANLSGAHYVVLSPHSGILTSDSFDEQAYDAMPHALPPMSLMMIYVVSGHG